MLDPADAKKLKTLPEWQRFEQHITQCIEVLDSCSGIVDGDDFAVAARGRKEAVKTLNKILEPFAYNPTVNHDKRIESMRKLGIVD